jgi:hypothetical protein
VSNYTRRTRHPVTGEFQDADWLDNYFGRWAYGVRFPDGRVFRAADYQWEFEDKPPAGEGSDA